MNDPDRKNWEVISAYKQMVIDGLVRPNVESWRCPWCGGPLVLDISPNLTTAAVACKNYVSGRKNACAKGLVATVSLRAPCEWHKEFVSLLWYEEGTTEQGLQ